MSVAAPATRPSRRMACSACRQRKVRCDGRATCQQCAHLNLRCIYSTATPTRKGIQRGSVISLHAPRSSIQPRVLQPRGSPVDSSLSPESPSRHQGAEHDFDDAFFSALMDDYVSSVYNFYPIVDEKEVLSCILRRHNDREASSFVYALAAAAISWKSGAVADQFQVTRIEKFAQTAVNLRQLSLDRSRPSILAIMTPMFLHLALAGLRKRDAAWVYLREAVTLAQLLVPGQTVETELGCQTISDPRAQRLYWMLFVQERFMGVRLGRAAVLAPLAGPPERQPALSSKLQRGFRLLVDMFRLLDSRFFMYWLPDLQGPHNDTSVVIDWIESSQAKLDSLAIHETLPHVCESQYADLVVTKTWLQVLFWQVALRACRLSYTAKTACLSLQFPLRLADGLSWIIGSLSRTQIEAHGNSMVYKLFEITVTIADVLCVLGKSDEKAYDMTAHLYSLADFVFRMDRLEEIQKTILQHRMDQVRDEMKNT